MSDKHAKYGMFKTGQKVRIVGKIDFGRVDGGGGVSEKIKNHFRRFQGDETTIIRKYYNCCGVECDRNHYGWSYDWFELADVLPKELFEI